MFKKELFTTDGPYLRYDNVIVARFKYAGPFTKAKFKKFLINSGLTVDNYFAMKEEGIAPLDVWQVQSPETYQDVLSAWSNK